MGNLFNVLTFLCMITVSNAIQPSAYHGVIAASVSTESEKLCVTFDPDWFTTKIYNSEDISPSYEVYDLLTTLNGCVAVTPGQFVNKTVVLIDTGPCTVVERVQNVVDVGSASLVVIARIDGGLNVTDVEKTQFSAAPILLININSYYSLLALDSDRKLYISFYVPNLKFDGNIVLIYVICIFCIVFGSYWSLYPRDMKLSEFWTTTPKPPLRLVLQAEEETDDQKGQLCGNLLFGGVIVALMAGMLLGTYFAFKYFVFLFIFMFCVISTTGMYSIIYPFLAEIHSDIFGIRWKVALFSKVKFICPAKIILWLGCFVIAGVWFSFRHQQSIWPLQVVMGIAVCLNIIISVPMPNMKIITIIMIMLFIYDIFFVFVTPYFTKDGMSIMEKVATGASGASKRFDAPNDYTPTEQIPLSIKIPYLQKCDLVACAPLYSLIGFGDIVIPGLLTSYAAYFDTLAHPNGRKWYYYAGCLSYAIGLVLTYVALMMMKVAQPALLYLVPCTLAGILATALKRGEIRALWTGRAGIASPEQFENETSES